MATSKSRERYRTAGTLAIDPRIRRIGAAYFEGALLIDWVTKNVRRDPPAMRVRTRLIPTLVRMLDRYEPTVLLIPDIGPKGVRRSTNVQETIQAVTREALDRGIQVCAISDRQVKSTFERVRRGAGRNKQTVNQIIVEWFPELEPFLPKVRRLWDSEAHATPLFDAVARYCAWQGLPVSRRR